MGILKFIQKVCVQTAVYWGNPQEDGYGQKTFDAPVEIKVRWEDVLNLMRTADGQELTCKAQVLVQQDVDRGGYLMLGSLDDIDSDITDSPQNIDDAYPILRMDKTPLFRKTDQFVRKAYV